MSERTVGEKLAQHGYTVRLGFFSGICAGSDQLPYEKDCSLIKQYIATAENKKESLAQVQSELLSPKTQFNAWFKEYIRKLERRRTVSKRIERFYMNRVVVYANFQNRLNSKRNGNAPLGAESARRHFSLGH